jgi:hypothetical protein
MDKKTTQATATKTTGQQHRRVRIRLKTAQDIARFQARCIRKAFTGEGATATQCYNLVTMSAMLLKTLEVASTEAKINFDLDLPREEA